MSGFSIGDTVRVLAESFARETGTVTDTDNGNIILTVTVRTHNDSKEWYFDPTDELELITDGSTEEPTRHD